MLIHSRYEYNPDQPLGFGGFSQTYLAEDTQTGKKCVLKEMSFRKVSDWKQIDLFEHEAKILANLDHPHIPRYIDHFSVEGTRDICYYLVYEYIEGKTLFEWVFEEKRPFTEAEILEIARQAADILGYLHSFDPPIIHRDIKPANMVLTPSHQLYFIDFGSIKDSLSATYMSMGSVSMTGTFVYMPPEQTRGKPKPASDIYALGVSLIHILARKSPEEMNFEDDRGYDFRPHMPQLSADFAQILDQMIAPRLEDRYPDVYLLQQDLRVGRVLKPIKKPDKAKIRWLTVPNVIVSMVIFVSAPILIKGVFVPATLTAAIGGVYVLFNVSRNRLQRLEKTRKEKEKLEADYRRLRALAQITDTDPRTGIEFVHIPGGTFKMGDHFNEGDFDEQPVHTVTLSDFQMAKYAVTNAQYARFLAEYGSDTVKDGEYKGEQMIYADNDWGLVRRDGVWRPVEGHDNHPVVYVTWYGANEFCQFYGYTLPSEAQWEYAARLTLRVQREY